MADPLFGVTWKMQKGASLFSVGPPPDSETRDYVEIPNGYTLTVKGIHAGQPYAWSYTALYDGAEYPVVGRPDVDAIVAYRVSDTVTLGIFKKNGNDVALYARAVADGGGGLRVQAAGKNVDGSTYFNVINYTT